MSDSRQTLFSVAHIAYVQDVGDVISNKDLSPISIRILSSEASLIKLSVRDSFGNRKLGKDTMTMLKAVEDSLRDIEQLLEDGSDADEKIEDLIIFVNQAEKYGRDVLSNNKNRKLIWLIK